MVIVLKARKSKSTAPVSSTDLRAVSWHGGRRAVWEFLTEQRKQKLVFVFVFNEQMASTVTTPVTALAQPSHVFRS